MNLATPSLFRSPSDGLQSPHEATGPIAPAQNPRYRPEIDGLRAIAVVLVILFHAQFRIAGFDLFAGGFIGVDIFFVISGYLIGLILLREIEDGRFSLIKFYERRARRILPALYLVLLATVPLAWLVLLPESMKSYAGALVSAILSAANIFFWREGSYDTEDNLINPMIHTWSLGVEEQFYLLFPAFLLLIAKFGNQRRGILLCGVCALSLVLAEITTSYAADASFFLLPSRIWELGLGALLALRELTHGIPDSGPRFVPGLGLAAILVSVPFMPVHLHHPGLLTLIPVLGTAMIIRYARPCDAVGGWLSSRSMVAMGLISYPLYLWHQPVLAFGRLLLVDEPTAVVKAGWILLAVILAAATYQFLERPTRDRRRVSVRTIWSIAFGGAVLLGSVGVGLLIAQGAPRRFPKPLDALVKAEVITEAGIFQGAKGCLNYVPSAGPCHFLGRHEAGYNLMLVGDSHARTLSGPLVDRLSTSSLLASVALLNRGGCLFLIGLTRVDAGIPSCPASYNAARMRYLMEGRRTIAVIFMRLPIVVERSRFDNGAGGVEPGNSPYISSSDGPYDHVANSAAIRAATVATIDQLLDGGVKVVLVYPVPEMGWNIPHKLMQLSRDMPSGEWLSPMTASVSRQQFRARSRKSYALLDAVGDHPDLARVYPENVFCAGQSCRSHDGTDIFYRDDNHLSRAGADRLASAILTVIARRWGDPGR